MRRRKCLLCGDKIVQNDENVIVFYDSIKGHILSDPNGKSGVKSSICFKCSPRVPKECVFCEGEYPYDVKLIKEKLVPYIMKKFKESGRCSFPTVAECARALKVRYGCIEQLVEDSDGVLMLTGYGGLNEPIGGLYVEILEIDASLLG